MAQFHDANTAHQLRRWMRPDAHRFVRPDWRRFVRPGYESDFPLALYERKHSPDQPRDDLGRWTSEGEDVGGSSSSSGTAAKPTSDDEADVNKILAQAKQIAAGSKTNYQRCLDLCSPILERFKSPGSDINTFDFHKCMNACLSKGN